MKTVWSWLGDEGVCDLIVLHIPLVLNLQLSHALGSSERNWELLDTAHEVVLPLVEDWLLLKNGEDLGLAVEVLLAEHEDGELVDIDVGLGSLHGEELRALWPGWGQLLDPFWFWTWRHCVISFRICQILKAGV